MKVMFHLNSMGKGGAERVVSILIDAMVKDNIDVVLTTLSVADEEYEIPQSVRRIVIDERITTNKRCILIAKRYTELRKIILSEKPNVVISFCNKANFRASLSMTGIKIPLIVSVRNDPDRDYAPYGTMNNIMVRRADGCVFQTKAAKEWFPKKLQDKSRIIINPINDKYLDVEVTDKIDEGRVVTVGRISGQKNQMLLLRTVNNLKEKYPKISLEIYGSDFRDGSKAQMERFIADHNLMDNVRFMGVCDDLEMRLQGAIFVLPSDYEGMPNALMEAMAIGLPVISTNCPCGGPSDLIDDERNGLLISVGDEKELTRALDRLLADRDKRIALGKEAMKIREYADSATIYRQWKEYIDCVVSHI